MMNIFTDPRDGEIYKTVEINGQTWLAENLRYKGPIQKFNDWVLEEKDFYYPPNGSRRNIKKYGCLYTWRNAIKACPEGWHLPSEKEFWGLLSYVKKHRKSVNNFLALIAKSTAWSNYKDQGGDDFAFGALPAGYCYCGNCGYFGYTSYLWSATGDGVDGAYNLSLSIGNANVNDYYKDCAFSVRCIKD